MLAEMKLLFVVALCWVSLVSCKEVNEAECKALFTIVDANNANGLTRFLNRTRYRNTKTMNLTKCKREEGFNPWLVAVDGGPLSMVKMLIDACDDATLRSTDDLNYNAILFAARTGNDRVLQALLAAEIDSQIIGKDSSTALSIACTHGHVDFVETLLTVTTPATLNHQASIQYQLKTPLMAAVVNDHSRIVKMLLEKGANAFLLDSYGSSVLERAIYYNNDEQILDMLIEHFDKNGSTFQLATCVTQAIATAIVKKNKKARCKLEILMHKKNITSSIIVPKGSVAPDIEAELARLYLNKPEAPSQTQPQTEPPLSYEDVVNGAAAADPNPPAYKSKPKK